MITHGFNLGYKGPRVGRRFARNHRLWAGNQTILWNKLMKEVQLGRSCGPWLESEIPFENFRQSPVTLIEKKGTSSRSEVDNIRLIFDLSWPHGDSLNNHTPQELRSCEYPLFDKTIRMCLEQGRGCYMSLADCKSAFEQLPLATDQFCLVMMMCEHPVTKVKYYFCDKTLCFGSATSCYLYMKVSNAIAHLFRYRTKNTRGDISNFLDDFQTCKIDHDGCNRYLEIFIEICNTINLPLSEDKIQWATQIMVFLGLQVDSVRQMVSIPETKIDRAIRELDIVIRSKKVTVKQLQSLTGLLNFFCRAVVPGRAFTRKMYAKMSGLRQFHHFRVDGELKADCKMWLEFVSSSYVYCRPFIDFKQVIHADQLDFYCDAALNARRMGVGARFKNFWFSGEMEMKSAPHIRDRINIQIAELYSIMLALSLWMPMLQNRRALIFTDNESVMHMLNRSSSSCKICMIMLRLITLWSMKWNARVFGAHVGTEYNTSADLLSRGKISEFLKLQEGVRFDLERERLPHEYWPMPLHWFY